MPAATAAFYHWNDAYSVHIGVIDTQHKNLVSMISELHEAMAAGKGKDKLGPILLKLIKYTQAHFATEERLMETRGYPDFPAHKAEHENLTDTVMDFHRRFQANEVGMTVEVMDFLANWLINHIQGSDKKYAPFLNAQGVR